MKLDKIAFAQVISYISSSVGSMSSYTIEELDKMIDVVVPLPEPAPKASCTDVDILLALMKEGTKKIEAIKAYRTLTGAGLKESKDAVERYWTSSEYRTAKKIKEDMIQSINRQQNRSIDDDERFVLEDFLSSQLDTIREFVESFPEYK